MKCTNCGEKLGEGARFCMICGAAEAEEERRDPVEEKNGGAEESIFDADNFSKRGGRKLFFVAYE